MPKKSLSSLELTALVNELQFLKRATISQIYHQNKVEVLIQFHVSGQGKALLKIVSGKLVCLTTQKDPQTTPTSFCMFLRKHLDHAYLKNIYQKDAERILVLELEKKEKFFLIIELFSKGNVVLTTPTFEIIGLLQEQEWKDRSVRSKEIYKFPNPGPNWKDVTYENYSNLLKKSNKRNLATALATDLGFGGVYAEELCRRAHIDKEKIPCDLQKKEIEKIVAALEEMLTLIKKPQGFFYEEDIAPFPLTDRTCVKVVETYNEAINTINPFPKISPYEKKIQALERTVADQESSMVEYEERILQNKQKGEAIYEHYGPLKKLLEIVTELKKEKTWTEIEKELHKEKKIKEINLKTKKITISLD